MKSFGRLWVGLCGCALLLGWAGTAAAAPYTLAAAVPFSNTDITGTVTGTINPVFDITGLIGPCDDAANPGACPPDFLNYDVFVVDITLTGGGASTESIDSFGMAVVNFFPVPRSAGAFFDPLPDEIPGVVLADQATLQGLYTFSGTANQLAPGETSARLFVSYQTPAGGLPTQGGEQVNFMISHGSDFQATGTVVLIPEPATLLLLGGAVAALLAARRRTFGT